MIDSGQFVLLSNELIREAVIDIGRRLRILLYIVFVFMNKRGARPLQCMVCLSAGIFVAIDAEASVPINFYHFLRNSLNGVLCMRFFQQLSNAA
jgi:hypothetical protein